MKVSILTGTLNGTPYFSSYLKNCGIEAEKISIDHVTFSHPEHKGIQILNEIVLKYLKDTSPDIVGISTWHVNYLVKEIKKLGIPIVLGGPETLKTISYLHEYSPETSYDFGIEGLPLDFPKLVDLINGENVSPKEIRGLVYCKDGKIKHNPPVWTKKYYLENKPDLEFVHPVWTKSMENLYKPSSRNSGFWVPDTFGCPHASCSFCSMEKPYLSFTPKEIVKLIEDVLEQEPDTPIGLTSQTINKITNICKELKEEKTVPDCLVFMCRADNFIKNYDKLIYVLESGIKLDADCIGFESFLQEDLNKLRKGTTVEQNMQTVKKLRKLSKRYDNFCYKNPNGHGLIPFLPWSTPKSIHEHFSILKKHEMWDIFNPYVLSNFLIVNWRESAEKDLFELSSANNPPVKTYKSDSFLGSVGATIWLYTDPNMLKLFKFSGELYKKISNYNTAFKHKPFKESEKAIKLEQGCTEASKYMIDNLYKVSEAMC